MYVNTEYWSAAKENKAELEAPGVGQYYFSRGNILFTMCAFVYSVIFLLAATHLEARELGGRWEDEHSPPSFSILFINDK